MGWASPVDYMVSRPARFAGVLVVVTWASAVNWAENIHVIVSSQLGGLKIVWCMSIRFAYGSTVTLLRMIVRLEVCEISSLS